MGAEIDSLEIKISADSKSASDRVLALADSMERLQGSAAGTRDALNRTADGIAAIKDALKGTKNIAQNVGELQTGLDALSRLKPPEGLQKLADAVKPLKEVSQTLASLNSDSDIQNTAKQIAQLSFGLTGLGNIRVEGAEKVKGFFETLNGIQLNPELAKTVNQFGNAAKKITEISPNENAADSLRLFIDTVRIITDEDAARLRAISEAAGGVTAFSPTVGEDGGTAYTIAAQIDETGTAAADAEPKLSRFREVLGGIAKASASAAGGVMKTVLSPVTAVGKTFSSAASKAGGFLNSLKRIAMYRALRTILKEISQGFREGRENLYQYSVLAGTDFAKSMDKAATASLYFKNSIGAATAPLTNYLVPILDRVIDRAVEFVNRFNEMTAVLTGASTWTRAVKFPTEWQEAADDAADSAKKLKSTMLGFDELNIIEPKSTGAKSTGLSADDYARMFEEVATDIRLGSAIPDILIPVKMAWDAEGDNTLREIRGTWESILGLVGSVGESVHTVWKNGTGQQTLETILQIVQEIVGTFGALTKGIKKAWDEGGKGTRIIQNVWNAANNVLAVFRDIWHAIREWAEGLDWNPLFDSFGDLFGAIDEITNPDGGAARLLKGFFDDVLLPLGKWTIEEALPKSISAVATAISTVSRVADKAQPVLKEIWDKFLKPIADWDGTTIINGLTGLKDLLEEINDAIDGNKTFGEFLNGLWGDMLTDPENSNGLSILENIGEFATKANPGSFFGQKLGKWASENWSLGWADIKGRFSSDTENNDAFSVDSTSYSLASVDYESELSALETFKQSWESGWTDIGQFFTDTWTGIRDWFQGNVDWWAGFWEYLGERWEDWKSSWKSGWETVKSTAKKSWDTVTGWLSDQWQGLKSKVTDYADTWNSGLTDIKSFVSDAWDSITGWIANNLTWSGIKSHVTEYARHFGEKFDEIKRDVHTKFDEIKQKIIGLFENNEIFSKAGKFTGTITSTFGNIWTGIKGSLGKLKEGFIGIFESIADSITAPINKVLSSIEGFVNAGIETVNEWLDRLSFLGETPAAKVLEDLIDASFDWKVKLHPIELPRLEDGGTVNSGQLFIANEAGPELVGRFGSQTGVMNNQQIVQAVSDGVYRAMVQALSQQQSSPQPIQNHIYLDRKEVTSQIETQQQSNGVPVFGNLVYT